MNIRQTFNTIRQEKLFSTIYIVGTALAITSVTMVVIYLYSQLADIAPETNRSKIYYMGCVSVTKESKNGSSSMPLALYSPEALENIFFKLKNTELISVALTRQSNTMVSAPTHQEEHSARAQYTDTNFFRLYQFRFMDGRPFTQEELDGGEHVAVITAQIARKLLGRTTDVVGETIFLRAQPYRICGVMEDVSPVCRNAFAHLYLPYKANENWEYVMDWMNSYVGRFEVTLLPKEGKEDAMKDEIREAFERLNTFLAQDDKVKVTFDIKDAPYNRYEWLTHKYGDDGSTTATRNMTRKYLMIFFALLFVPALNLSGMVGSRMLDNAHETAVRRAFGASRIRLMGEVIYNNLSLTLCGGILGIILSWFIVFTRFGYFLSMMHICDTGDFNPVLNHHVLFAPSIFLATFLFCALLNLVAALIPVWWNLRRPIVESLSNNEQ